MSADTIRHYEKLRLLKAPPRQRNGYRDYGSEAVARVQLIRRALGVGFSLHELAEILQVRDRGGVPCRTAFAKVKSKLEELDREIKDLKTMRHELKRVLRDWSDRLAGTRAGQPARLLDTLPEGVDSHAHAHVNRFSRGLRGRLGTAGTKTDSKPAS